MLADPCGYQVWLELPEPWHGDELVARARERGVLVVGAGAFAIGRDTPAAVRLPIGLPPLAALAEGLAILDELITEGSTPAY